jgi:hypothetical protein
MFNMKWMKLFEGFENGDLFQYIDNGDYWDNQDSRIEMSSSTIRIISELFNNWDIEIGDDNDVIYLDNVDIPIKNYRYEIRLYEVYDEYFYINITRCYHNGGSFNISYKCDQFEGLVELLKDKNIIKI